MPESDMLNVVMGIALDAKEFKEIKEMRDMLKDINDYQDNISKGRMPTLSGSKFGGDSRKVEEGIKTVEAKTDADSREIKKGIANSVVAADVNTAEILNSVNRVQSEIALKVTELTSRFNAGLHTNVTMAEKTRFVKEEFTAERALKTAKIASSKYVSKEAFTHVGVQGGTTDDFNEMLANILYKTSGEVEGSNIEGLYNIISNMENKGINVRENLEPLLRIIGESSRTLGGLGMKVGKTTFGNKDLTFTSTFESMGLKKAGQSEDALKTWNKLRTALPQGASELELSPAFLGETMKAGSVDDIKKIMKDNPKYGLTPQMFNMEKGKYIATQGASKYLYQLQGEQSKGLLKKAGVTMDEYMSSITSHFADLLINMSPDMIEQLKTATDSGNLLSALEAIDPQFAGIPKENRAFIENAFKSILDRTKTGEFGHGEFEGKVSASLLSQVAAKYPIGTKTGAVTAVTIGQVTHEGIPNLLPAPGQKKSTKSTTEELLQANTMEQIGGISEQLNSLVKIATETGSDEILKLVKDVLKEIQQNNTNTENRIRDIIAKSKEGV
jgi:hypothetical protein